MLTRLALIIAAGALLSACSAAEPPSRPRATTPAPSPASPTPSVTDRTPGDDTPRTVTAEAGPARVRIVAGEILLTATLRDSAAARDLLAQLPVTLSMQDHGGVEKTGPLPGPLTIDGEPEGADPDPADLGYYAPGNDLVLYYGDQSYFDGIVVLGTLEEISTPSPGQSAMLRSRSASLTDQIRPQPRKGSTALPGHFHMVSNSRTASGLAQQIESIDAVTPGGQRVPWNHLTGPENGRFLEGRFK